MDKIVSSVSAFFGGLGSYFFGGWSMMLEFLLLIVVLDYVTGIVASLKEGKGLNSKVGFWGITKKVAIFILIAVMYRADLLLETNFLMAGAVWFYIANELISVLENLARIDILIPPQIKNLLAMLKEKTGQKNE